MRSIKSTLLRAWLLMLCGVMAAPACTAETKSEVSALFINVRKADAILICLDDQRYLVDAGHKDSYEDLERALETYGITRLNGVFITHTDKDHVGGLNKLLKSDIQVDQLYASALHSEKDAKDHPVYEASEKREVPLRWLRAGDVVEAGASAFHVIGPLRQDSEDEDNNSLVMDLRTPEGNILLTGDMKSPEETQLLMQGVVPKATVLKVAHHGEDDSTSLQFVRTVAPQWSVISTNTDDEPDTAADVVLARLFEVKSGVAITQNASLGILVTLKDGQASAQQLDYQ